MLPPTAYIDRPIVVKFKIIAAIIPMMIIMTMGTGILRIVPPKKFTTPDVLIGLPSDMTSVNPLATDIMASVAMKDGSLRYALAMPLKAPKTAPATMPTTTVNHAGMPMEAPAYAANILETAATDPTERSIPAATMAKVSPKARMATVAACMPTLRMFDPVRKAGVARERMMASSMRPIKAPFLMANFLISSPADLPTAVLPSFIFSDISLLLRA